MICVRTNRGHSDRVAVWCVQIGTDGFPLWSMVDLGPPGDRNYRSDLRTVPARFSMGRFSPADAVWLSGLPMPAAWDWVLEHA